MPGGYPPALAVKEFPARGFPEAFSAVFAGWRFRFFTGFPAFTDFPAFFDFALTVGASFPDARCERVHFRLPRAFA